jgi:hypothetical protein
LSGFAARHFLRTIAKTYCRPTTHFCGLFLAGEIKIRAAHEIMAARTTQLALLVDQLMPALQAKPPMFTGVFGRDEAGVICE